MEKDGTERRPEECGIAKEKSGERQTLGKQLKEEEKMCPRGFAEIAFCLPSKWGRQRTWPQPEGAGSAGRMLRC